MTVFNRDAIPDAYIEKSERRNELHTLYLGHLAGSERLYVNIDQLQPGAHSAKLHSHSVQEEFFLVLSGQGTLRLGDRRIAVKAGDFFAKPAGRGTAHQFINDGDQMLEILDMGTRDDEDVVRYPEEGVQLDKASGVATRGSEVLTDWSSDPNSA